MKETEAQEPEFENQRDLFNHLWETKEHKSEISGKPLYGKEEGAIWYHQFSHTLNKGRYPGYKCKAFNIVMMLPNEHNFYEHFVDEDRQTPMYKMYRDKWEALFELREQLKSQYYSVKLT